MGTKTSGSCTLLVLVILAWQLQAEPAPTTAMAVTTAHATETLAPEILPLLGSVVPAEEARVACRVANLPLKEVLVRVGDHVQRGQLMARFDDRIVRNEVEQEQARLEQAVANNQEAANIEERVKALAPNGALSEVDLLRYQTRLRVSAAALSQARATLAAAMLKLEYTSVAAPDSGTISARSAELGEVPALGAELFRFIRLDRLEWHAEASQAQLARVAPGMLAFIDVGGRAVMGRVTRLAPALDPTSRLGIIYVALSESSGIRTASYVSGHIELVSRKVVLVPSLSIVFHDGRSYVVTMLGSRAKLVPVVVGTRTTDVSEVLSGIQAGDTVIVRGAGFLSDGAPVRVVGKGVP